MPLNLNPSVIRADGGAALLFIGFISEILEILKLLLSVNCIRGHWQRRFFFFTFIVKRSRLQWRCMPSHQEIIADQFTLHELYGPGRIYSFWAYSRTFSCIMAVEHGFVGAYDTLAAMESIIPGINNIAIGLCQSHRPQVVLIGSGRRAGCNTGAALDAVCELQIFYELLGRLDELAAGRLHLMTVRAYDIRIHLNMLFEKGGKIRHKISDHSEIRQRSDSEGFVGYIKDLSIAGKHWFSIDEHRARTADAHSAGEPKGKRGILRFLYAMKTVENSHSLFHGKFVQYCSRFLI